MCQLSPFSSSSSLLLHRRCLEVINPPKALRVPADDCTFHVNQRVYTPILPSRMKFPDWVLQPVVCSGGCGGAQMSLFILAGINRCTYSAMKTNHSRARCPFYCHRRGNENVIWANLSHAPSCSSICKKSVIFE